MNTEPFKVAFYFRKPRPEFHSIEQIFHSVSSRIKREFANWKVVNTECLHSRISLLKMYRNVRYAQMQRGTVNHITGDVHYLVLGLPSKKTILTVHDCVLLDQNRTNWLRLIFFKFMWYYLPIKRAAVVTAISEKTRQELFQYIGQLANRVIVIPNCYNPCFTYVAKAFNKSTPVLLQIGTSEHKNLDRLVEAIEGLTCRLLIVGKLSDKQKENLINRHVNYVHYINVSQEQIVNLYEKCDIVTFVSLYEGFGMPVLEGQVVGRPVVTSNISPLTEVGGAGACYVDPTDVEDIRRGILRVCKDESYRNELIRAGQENAQQYTVEKISARYAAIYESLVGTDLTY